MRIFGARCFYREHALAYPKAQCTYLWQSRGRNLYRNFDKRDENQLSDAGRQHPENPNSAPLLRGKQEIDLLWHSKLGQCQQGPLTIGLQSLLFDLPTKADEPHLAMGLLSEFPSPR